MNQPEERLKRIEDQQANFDKRLKEVEHQTDIGILKIEMQGVRADILQIRESQADQRDTLKEHGQHLKAIKDDQDAHREVSGKLVTFAESHDGILTALQTDVSSIKSTQEQILKLLQQKSGE